MKKFFIQVWILFIVFSGLVFGQDEHPPSSGQSAVTVDIRDSTYYNNDTIPGDSLILMPDTLLQPVPDISSDSLSYTETDTINIPRDSLAIQSPIPQDSLQLAQDSMVRRVVVGLTDPLDTLSNRLFAYQVLHENSYARIQVPIDTTLTRFQINNPVMRDYFAGAYLGNTGLSYYPIGFEARKRPSDFPFLDHVSLYLHDPERTTYYQVQTPYTMINYSSAGPKAQNESILNLVHTQNVNKNWNVGLYYDIYSSAGQFVNQNAANNGFSLFSAYRGAQYSMYANFNWNNVRMKENSGLAEVDTFLINYDTDANNQLVRSKSGKTVLLNRSLYINHSYSLRKLNLFNREKNAEVDSVNVSRFTLVHTFKYEWNKREFSDTATYAFRPEPSNFHTNTTHDSIYFRRIFNHFELMIKEQARNRFTAGFSVGLLNEMDRYNTHIIPDTAVNTREVYHPVNPGWGVELPNVSITDTIVSHRTTKKYFNTAITGRFFNHTGRYLNWDFNGRFYFTGYKLGDLNINGTVQLHYYSSKGRNTLMLGGSLETAQPSYFLNQHVSNWQVWDNDFNASQEIRLRGEFVSPHNKLKIGAYVSQLNNHVYFGTEAIPQQASDMIMTATALIEKDFHWWKLGFRFRLYGQYSTHEKIIPLPAFAGYQSTYFEGWLVRKVLLMQFGWDINYNTKYYAYSYMPSSGMFYLQEEQKIGNYPFVDFFLNFQIKRARIFVKTDGLSTLLNKQLGKEYFMVYRYPLNEFRVKFGVSWAFYD